MFVSASERAEVILHAVCPSLCAYISSVFIYLLMCCLSRVNAEAAERRCTVGVRRKSFKISPAVCGLQNNYITYLIHTSLIVCVF